MGISHRGYPMHWKFGSLSTKWIPSPEVSTPLGVQLDKSSSDSAKKRNKICRV